MSKLIRATLIAGLVLFTAWSAFSQDNLNSDAVSENIKQLEAMTVEGRSVSFQRTHKQALLGLYAQLQSALQRDIDDLKKIQTLTAPSDAKTLAEIGSELNRINSDMTRVTTTIATLRSALPPVAPTQLPATSGTLSDNGSATTNETPASAPPGSSSNAADAGATQTANTLNDDLNNRVQEAVRARIQQRDNTKQTEPPSVATNSTSLITTSSGADFVNVGFTLAGLTTNNNNNDANANGSVSVTTSAYALYALARNVDFLNPGFYNRHSGWRKLSFTLGYDDEKLKDGTTEKAPIFGFKYLFVDKRDPGLKRHEGDLRRISANLQKASVAFGNLSNTIVFSFAKNPLVRQRLIPQFRAFLTEKLKTLGPGDTDARARITNLLKEKLDTGEVFRLDQDGMPPLTNQPGVWTTEENQFYQFHFQNVYLGADYRTKLKDAFGQKVLDDLDAFVSEQLTDTKAFEDLSDTTVEAIERIRRAPQFSFSFLTKQRSETSDEYHAETIFDYGLANRIDLTLNGGFLYTDSKLVGGDSRGGKFAGQFRFQLTPERLEGRNPLYFFIAGNAESMSGRKPLYRAQAKLNIPLLNGVDLPLALTYSNREEADKKHKTRVQFGFAIDTARIIQAITSK